MDTIQAKLLTATHQLKQAGIEHPGFEARILLAHILGLTIEQLLLRREHILESALITIYENYIIERCKQKPIAYLIGYREFYRYQFLVNSSVLIPRADSEILIEAVLKDQHIAPKILELGTGSGCLIITLLLSIPASSGIAIELCSSAITVAQNNSKLHNTTERLELYNQNWLDFPKEKFVNKFDMIIANPPYIKRGDNEISAETLNYEPHIALFGGDDGLSAYRQIILLITTVLKDSGKIYLEIGPTQVAAVRDMLRPHLQLQQIYYDLANRPRVLKFAKQKD